MKRSLLFLISPVPGIVFSQPFTMLKTIDGTLANGPTFVQQAKEVAGTLYFNASSTEDLNCYKFWKTDGTAIGTVKVKNVCALNLTDVNGVLYFSSGGQLWKSNGTTAGTEL